MTADFATDAFLSSEGAVAAVDRTAQQANDFFTGSQPCVGLLSLAEHLEALEDFDVREVPA